MIREFLDDSNYVVESNGEVFTCVSKQGHVTPVWRRKETFLDPAKGIVLGYKNKKLVLHRIIYTKYCGPLIKGCTIRHKDGNKNNNHFSNLEQIYGTGDYNGSLSGSWRGGQKYWQLGRKGKDKDGLFWKKQRSLCWARDNYTCQKCGFTKVGWKPHCHHITPYSISHSHALDNLKSLCGGCHGKEEAEIDAALGRRRFSSIQRPQHPMPHTKVFCEKCGSRHNFKNIKDGVCKRCIRDGQVKIAKDMRSSGLSLEEIMETLGISDRTVRYYLYDL